MATKKNAPKKTDSKKDAAKKNVSKKAAAKKTTAKKTVSKKTNSRKSTTKKPAAKKKVQKKSAEEPLTPGRSKAETTAREQLDTENIAPPVAISRSVTLNTPPVGTCICRQKKPNGKFFCFRLVQGRWVQSSGVPFPTKELCEEVCC